MIILPILITTIYTILILSLIIGFDKVKLFSDITSTTKNGFSIIIPFRNEAENLLELLNSLSKLKYPINLFEIILIDDDSTDESVEIINNFIDSESNIKIIKNVRKSNSPKKDAIETAIQISKFDWIVTTDADCIVPNNWLNSFDGFIQNNNPKMICVPVTYKVNNSFLQQFQLLDFISLIGSTIGGFGIKKPFLCNGANLCYSRKAFIEVKGFKGNNNISSGDDIFLLEKIVAKYPNDVHFLKSKNSIVITKPQSTIKGLIAQRVRWASKTSATKNWFGKFVGASVLLMNTLVVILLVLMLSNIISWIDFLYIFFIKLCVDFILILRTLNFTKQTKNVLFYPIIAVFYSLFIVFVSFLAIIKINFSWKNR